MPVPKLEVFAGIRRSAYDSLTCVAVIVTADAAPARRNLHPKPSVGLCTKLRDHSTVVPATISTGVVFRTSFCSLIRLLAPVSFSVDHVPYCCVTNTKCPRYPGERHPGPVE